MNISKLTSTNFIPAKKISTQPFSKAYSNNTGCVNFTGKIITADNFGRIKKNLMRASLVAAFASVLLASASQVNNTPAKKTPINLKELIESTYNVKEDGSDFYRAAEAILKANPKIAEDIIENEPWVKEGITEGKIKYQNETK